MRPDVNKTAAAIYFNKYIESEINEWLKYIKGGEYSGSDKYLTCCCIAAFCATNNYQLYIGKLIDHMKTIDMDRRNRIRCEIYSQILTNISFPGLYKKWIREQIASIPAC